MVWNKFSYLNYFNYWKILCGEHLNPPWKIPPPYGYGVGGVHAMQVLGISKCTRGWKIYHAPRGDNHKALILPPMAHHSHTSNRKSNGNFRNIITPNNFLSLAEKIEKIPFLIVEIDRSTVSFTSVFTILVLYVFPWTSETNLVLYVFSVPLKLMLFVYGYPWATQKSPSLGKTIVKTEVKLSVDLSMSTIRIWIFCIFFQPSLSSLYLSFSAPP